MLIRDRGVVKEVTEKQYKNKFQQLGYKVVEVEETNELADMTRAELYELAREEDVEGRSEMDKAQLLEALKEVG